MTGIAVGVMDRDFVFPDDGAEAKAISTLDGEEPPPAPFRFPMGAGKPLRTLTERGPRFPKGRGRG